jgi:ABC-type sugar transport system ATPase subunit
MGMVSLRGIRKSYGNGDTIKGIDLEVANGEFLVFVGPSGCGKSTTLRMIAGLESVGGGDLLIDGARSNDLRPADRGAAMAFRPVWCWPNISVIRRSSTCAWTASTICSSPRSASNSVNAPPARMLSWPWTPHGR